MGEFNGSAACARIFELINQAQTIAISGHTSPDGDALGSALGLGQAIEGLFHEKRVSFLLADDAEVPRVLRFLPGAERFEPASAYTATPGLFIMVDSPHPGRVNHAEDVFYRAGATAVFDHHPAASEVADAVVRDTHAAACAVIIEKFLRASGVEIDPVIATGLMTGIVTDTGRFQYQNADAAAFASAARLVAAGADPAWIALNVYQSQRPEYLRLKGLVMKRLMVCPVEGGAIAYSFATHEDLERCGVSPDECDGLIDIVRSVGGVDVCLFLRSTADGRVRGNLRSKSALDVSVVAGELGGGGHVAAAGFTFAGTVDEALGAVLPRLRALIAEADQAGA